MFISRTEKTTEKYKNKTFFFFKQKTAYEIGVRLVGSEMCIRDRPTNHERVKKRNAKQDF